MTSLPTGAPILFVQINSAPPTQSETFVDIPGLVLELPKRTSIIQESALILLNVPQPFANGQDFPGIDFGINFNNKVVATGGFTYPMKTPESFARVPFTLVVRVDLLPEPSQVRAQWLGVRGSTCHIDTFASLSAVIGQDLA